MSRPWTHDLTGLKLQDNVRIVLAQLEGRLESEHQEIAEAEIEHFIVSPGQSSDKYELTQAAGKH